MNYKIIKLFAIFTITSMTGCVSINVKTDETPAVPAPILVNVNVVVDTPVDKNNPVHNDIPDKEKPVEVITKTVRVTRDLCPPLKRILVYPSFDYNPVTEFNESESIRYAEQSMAWIRGVELLLNEAKLDASCNK